MVHHKLQKVLRKLLILILIGVLLNNRNKPRRTKMKTKTIYYVFKGQNATFGNPNLITGLRSTFGELISFSTMQKRDRFYNEYYDNNPGVFVIKCNKSSARQYMSGSTVQDYNEMLERCAQDADEYYYSYFGDEK